MEISGETLNCTGFLIVIAFISFTLIIDYMQPLVFNFIRPVFDCFSRCRLKWKYSGNEFAWRSWNMHRLLWKKFLWHFHPTFLTIFHVAGQRLSICGIDLHKLSSSKLFVKNWLFRKFSNRSRVLPVNVEVFGEQISVCENINLLRFQKCWDESASF